MHLSWPTTDLQTPRLQLRAFRACDFPAYAAYHSQADVYRFLYMAPPAGAQLREQFSSVLSAPFATDGDTRHMAVVRTADGAVIGEVLLKIASLSALQLEVGYIFHPHYAGHGYATEAVAAMLHWGFDGMQAHRIFARLDALNLASVKLVERLGMRREAHLIQNDRFDGTWGDEYIYAVLRSEYDNPVVPGEDRC